MATKQTDKLDTAVDPHAGLLDSLQAASKDMGHWYTTSENGFGEEDDGWGYVHTEAVEIPSSNAISNEVGARRVRNFRDIGGAAVGLSDHVYHAEMTVGGWVARWMETEFSRAYTSPSDNKRRDDYMRNHSDALADYVLDGDYPNSCIVVLLTKMRESTPEITIGEVSAMNIAARRPDLIMKLPGFFESLDMNSDFVRAVMEHDQVCELAVYIERFDAVAQQLIVDELSRRDEIGALHRCLLRVSAEVAITNDVWAQLIRFGPHTAMLLLEKSHIKVTIEKTELLRMFAQARYYETAISYAYFRELSLQEILEVYPIAVKAGGVMSAAVAAVLINRQYLQSIEDMQIYLQFIPPSSLVYEAVCQFSSDLQSVLFEAYIKTPEGAVASDKLLYFQGVSSECCLRIFDHEAFPYFQRKADPYKVEALFKNAEGIARERYIAELKPMIDARRALIESVDEDNRRRLEQSKYEMTYFDEASRPEAAEFDAKLSNGEIIEALELNHCVKNIGNLREIAEDESRVNIVHCLAGETEGNTTHFLGADATEKTTYVRSTEQGALQEYIEVVESLKEQSEWSKQSFDSLIDDLSFVGEKEYLEATRGIAVYWKWFLDQDVTRQICAGAKVSHAKRVKSDRYLLDAILQHFSDDELERYKGRLVLDESKIVQQDPAKLKMVFVDDWTISGSQLRDAASSFLQLFPDMAASIEVQLVAASKRRIMLGLDGVTGQFVHGLPQGSSVDRIEKNIPVVVRAYYLAHEPDVQPDTGDTRITGFHSSVDYGFMVDINRLKGSTQISPMLTNVIRPYRMEGYVPTHIERWQRVNREVPETTTG